jgi:hypothetical protein
MLPLLEKRARSAGTSELAAGGDANGAHGADTAARGPTPVGRVGMTPGSAGKALPG